MTTPVENSIVTCPRCKKTSVIAADIVTICCSGLWRFYNGEWTPVMDESREERPANG